MSFGHWMEIRTGKQNIRLGPVKREDMTKFVSEEADFGMNSYEVGKFLGVSMPQTEQSEQAFWDSMSVDPQIVYWGIYVPVDDGWRLIGSTSLRFRSGDHRRAESGLLIFDRQYWRQGVAGTSHLGRTRYAFDELDILAIDSFAFADNPGSNRALRGMGYAPNGQSWSQKTVHGQPRDTNRYTLVNPGEEAWNYFWRRPEADIPQEAKEARTVAIAGLARAREAVRFL